MSPKILSHDQIEQFIELGYTKLEGAFPREAAETAQGFLWGKLAERGARRDDRATWKNPMEFIAENYNTPPFDRCATPRLSDACSDLVGAGRWMNEGQIGWWGWWPVNFAVGADQPWDVPADEWHIDTPDSGTHNRAPDQGLLVICLFSELRPRGGGTLIVEGSHKIVPRYFEHTPGLTQREANDAICRSHPYLRELTGRGADGPPLPGTDTSNHRGAHAGTLAPPRTASETTPRVERFMNRMTLDECGAPLRVTELTGSPGDVFLGHPFLFHSPSFNHAGTPRFMCNRKTPLREPLNLDRPGGGYSPLEESIRRSLPCKPVARSRRPV